MSVDEQVIRRFVSLPAFPMPTPRKPTAGFWIVVGLCVLLVGYPLSFGPACWLADRDMLPDGLVESAYRPFVIGVVEFGLAKSACWYGELLPTPQPQPNPTPFGHGAFRISIARSLLLEEIYR